MQARAPPTVLDVSGEQHKKDMEAGRDRQKKNPQLAATKKKAQKETTWDAEPEHETLSW